MSVSKKKWREADIHSDLFLNKIHKICGKLQDNTASISPLILSISMY